MNLKNFKVFATVHGGQPCILMFIARGSWINNDVNSLLQILKLTQIAEYTQLNHK